MESRWFRRLAALSLLGLALGVTLSLGGGCLPPPGPPDDGSSGDGSSDGGTNDDPNGPPPQSISVEVIVRTNDAVPGQSGAKFTYFGNPVVDDAGRVAFYAAYSGGSGNGGLYVWQNGTLQRIYDSDPSQTGVVPGMGADAFFGGFTIRWDAGSLHLAWGANGRLLYCAAVNDSPQPNALFRWRARDGDVFPVGSAELLRATIPDSTDDFLPEYYHPGVSNDGIAMFSNRYSYFREDGSFSLFNRGIFTTDGRTTEETAVGSVPGQPAGVSFGDKPVLLTTHNASGDFLFQAAYESGEGDRGVYLLRGGEIIRVIDNAPGRSFPGLPAGAQVGAEEGGFQALAIGEQGDIAIDTTLTVDNQTRDTVLLWNGSQWHELRNAPGRYASDLLAGVSDDGQTVYLAGGRPYLGNGESVTDPSATLPSELSDVELKWEPFGGAVNNYGRVVLRYRRTGEGGGVGLVLWTGEQLLLVLDTTQPVGLDSIDVIFPVEQREVANVDREGTVSDRPEVNRPGLSGMLNDRDELVFRAGYLGPDGQADTADDEQAIFLGRGG